MLRSADSVQGPGELQLKETRISGAFRLNTSSVSSVGPSVESVSDTWYLSEPPRTYKAHVKEISKNKLQMKSSGLYSVEYQGTCGRREDARTSPFICCLTSCTSQLGNTTSSFARG